MGTYRFYFYDNHIVGRFDFQADGDDQAAENAQILFHACSDRCQSWEIWEGNVFLARGPQRIHEIRLRYSELTEQRRENLIQYEEAILNSQWAISSSRRLLSDLATLKASKKLAFGHSASS